MCIRDSHHINIIGENVIRLESNDLVDKTDTAMQVAVRLICKFDEESDRIKTENQNIKNNN